MSSISSTWFGYWSRNQVTNDDAGPDANADANGPSQTDLNAAEGPEQKPASAPAADGEASNLPAKRKVSNSSAELPSAGLKRKLSSVSLSSKRSANWSLWRKDVATQQLQDDKQNEIVEDEEREDHNDEDVDNGDDITADDNGDEVDDHVTNNPSNNNGTSSSNLAFGNNGRKGLSWLWTGTSNNVTSPEVSAKSTSGEGEQSGTKDKDKEKDRDREKDREKERERDETRLEDVKKDETKREKIVSAANTIVNSTPSLLPAKQDLLLNGTKKNSQESQADDAVLYKPHDKTAQFNKINTHKNEDLKENTIVPAWSTCLPQAHQGHFFHSSSTSNQNNANQTIKTDLTNWKQFLNQISNKFGFHTGPLSDADSNLSNKSDKVEKEFGLLYERSYKLYGKSLALLPEEKRACLPNYNKYYTSIEEDPHHLHHHHASMPTQFEEDQSDPNSISITNDAMGNLLINSNKGNKRKALHQALNAEIVNRKSLEPLKKIKNILIIGVHGFFPTKMIRPLIGAPKGTSLKFANEAEKAVIRYCIENNLITEDESNISIQKIALEKEGKIFDRVHFFTEILQKWEKELNNADFIFIASHSQGCVVSIILLARLIRMGILKDPIHKRIGLLGMAGINNGPFYGADKSFFMKAYSAIEHDSMNELFELTKFDSPQSLVYKESIQTVINVNVKICFIGSINDQLVPLYSALASHVFHPNIYRACYLDYMSMTPKFIEKLVAMCTQLLNLGFFDNNVVKELSTSLAGPLTGGGHSKIYNDGKVYDLGIKFALDTDDLVIPHEGKIDYDDFENSELPVSNQVYIKEYNVGKIGTNPFILPWCLRGLLFNVEKNWPDRHDGESNGALARKGVNGNSGFVEVHDLYEIFEHWKPDTKIYKDLKFRLNGFRASKL
ncbi:uncharacterized protein LODBEIA_P34810 [Lodderomyces beijingensis]|uniref:YMC020W-like alpha/beta hydrolase domain-containing protein n=1 Tax=Lodderomyces beijingensis TaxID=1775926 RepID=A0ABP0ZSK4_9ASCO